MTDPAEANLLCASHPGAAVSQPFGPDVDVWKVGAKIFAAVSAAGVVTKTNSTETAALVIEMGHGLRAPYFHASWVLVPFASVPPAELAERIATSYGLIRGSLPKKLQAGLGA
jgi:predicted DNA-binding protein (MmcQ/YjbR family)